MEINSNWLYQCVAQEFAVTNVWRKNSQSGQQNPDAFPDIFLPDATSQESRAAMYCAASFHVQPSFDQVVKLIPRNCAAEEGVPGSSIVAERDDVGEDEDHPVRDKRKGIRQGGTSRWDIGIRYCEHDSVASADC
jgi:hypothetical protein